MHAVVQIFTSNFLTYLGRASSPAASAVQAAQLAARVDSGEIPLKLSLVKVAESPDNRNRALTHAFLPSMAGDSATGTQ